MVQGGSYQYLFKKKKKLTSKKQVITIILENSVISSFSKRLTVLTLYLVNHFISRWT